MTKILLSTLFIGLMTFSFGQATNYSNGATVADFTVTTTDGDTYTLYEITATGKYVMLDFFFDTCPPCQSTTPLFNEVHDKYGCNDGDIFLLSVNNGTDTDAEVEAFEASYGGTFHHAPGVSADGGGGAVTSTFGVGAFPTYCLIGPDNKMVQNDIWPLSSIGDLEAAFPVGFNPSVQACTFAGVEENTLSELSVFPNPTNIELNMTFDATTSATATIEIINILGEVVISNNIETTIGANYNTIDVEGLATGQYVARIAMNDQVATVKFNKL